MAAPALLGPGRCAVPIPPSPAPGRMQPRGLLLLLALLLLAAAAEAAKAKKGERESGWARGGLGVPPRLPAAASLAEKMKKEGSECQDWHWGPCIPNSKDCGLGYREGSCGDESRKLKCKIPCNWKKKFGGAEVAVGGPGLCWGHTFLMPLPSCS